MLYTRCILRLPDETDGTRISVMSGHTLKDGRTPDPQIKNDLWDIHAKILAPSRILLGDYYLRGLPWEKFVARYTEEIKAPRKQVWVKIFAHQALTSPVTFLCIEKTADTCHRRLLAEECQRLFPALTITHR